MNKSDSVSIGIINNWLIFRRSSWLCNVSNSTLKRKKETMDYGSLWRNRKLRESSSFVDQISLDRLLLSSSLYADYIRCSLFVDTNKHYENIVPLPESLSVFTSFPYQIDLWSFSPALQLPYCHWQEKFHHWIKRLLLFPSTIHFVPPGINTIIVQKETVYSWFDVLFPSLLIHK